MLNKVDNWFISKTVSGSYIKNEGGKVVSVGAEQIVHGTDLSSSFGAISSSYTVFSSSFVLLSGSTAQQYSALTQDSHSFTASINWLYRINPNAGSFSIELPSASLNYNKEIGFKVQSTNMSGSVITIYPAGTDTIDLSAYFSLYTPLQYISLKSDGVSDWMVL